jgi:hypothetical protein
MSSKLSSVNPYLRDAVVRKSMVVRSVVTSSAIDGIRVGFEKPGKNTDKSPVRERRSTHEKVSVGIRPLSNDIAEWLLIGARFYGHPPPIETAH